MMGDSPLFDFTEVSFRGKQYKFLRETPPKSVTKAANTRSRSVMSPLPDLAELDEPILLTLSSQPPDTPTDVFRYDIEQIKHFGELPSEQFRTPHVDFLSPEEERRVLHILKMPPRQVEKGQRRKLGEAARGSACIQDVFEYFQDIKRYNKAEKSPAKTVRLPKLRGRVESVPLRKGSLLRK